MLANRAALLLNVQLLLPFVIASHTPIVQTNFGNVVGLKKSYPDGQVLQYLGIPFAEPPVGPLRFAKPRQHSGWNKTLMATTFGPSCMQYIFSNDAWLIPTDIISEDCLQLNVFVPRSIDTGKPKSVMIWIHGGGFYAGQATLFDGSYLALTGDVIIVTTNYRLGLFGFISTEDDTSPGNYGLWDQHLAFRWVKENIANFGGDPNNVCIFGESAGGYSVGLHTVSPVNRNYFQRAISESGAVISPRAFASEASDVAMKTGTLLNCSTDSSPDLISCLKSKSAESILLVQSKAMETSTELNFVNRLGPVLDGDFITVDPDNILKNPKSPAYEMFKSVDIMAGTNNAEGGLLYFSLTGFQYKFKFNISEGIPRTVLCDLVAPAIARDFYNSSATISKAICDEYTVNGSPVEQARSILDIYAHTQFIIPTIRTLVDHATIRNTSSYHYLFSHQPSFSWIQERPRWLKGANHAGELPFVFGLHAMYKNSSRKPAEELTLSRRMMVYWSNFAKTGNPNKPESPDVFWPTFEADHRVCMELKVNVGASVGPFDEKYRFWTVKVPSLTHGGAGVTTALDPGHGTQSQASGDKNTGLNFAVDLLVLCVVLIAFFLFIS